MDFWHDCPKIPLSCLVVDDLPCQNRAKAVPKLGLLFSGIIKLKEESLKFSEGFNYELCIPLVCARRR